MIAQPPSGPRRTDTPDDAAFSVVIATFNRGRLILPTIESVLRQTRPAHEIIVVGDGCTDDTGEILAATFGDRVRWTNLERNLGSQAYANNEGIRLATGTHIAYLGHDDSGPATPGGTGEHDCQRRSRLRDQRPHLPEGPRALRHTR